MAVSTCLASQQTISNMRAITHVLDYTCICV